MIKINDLKAGNKVKYNYTIPGKNLTESYIGNIYYFDREWAWISTDRRTIEGKMYYRPVKKEDIISKLEPVSRYNFKYPGPPNQYKEIKIEKKYASFATNAKEQK